MCCTHQSKGKEKEREVVCGHTWSSGQPYCGARGAVGGSVPCSRVSPQSWYWRWREHLLFTPPTDNPCRTWESNRQPLGYKSNSLTIRPRLPLFFFFLIKHSSWICPVNFTHFLVSSRLKIGLCVCSQTGVPSSQSGYLILFNPTHDRNVPTWRMKRGVCLCRTWASWHAGVGRTDQGTHGSADYTGRLEVLSAFCQNHISVGRSRKHWGKPAAFPHSCRHHHATWSVLRIQTAYVCVCVCVCPRGALGV